MLTGKNLLKNGSGFCFCFCFTSNDKVYAFKKKCKMAMVSEVRTYRR